MTADWIAYEPCADCGYMRRVRRTPREISGDEDAIGDTCPACKAEAVVGLKRRQLLAAIQRAESLRSAQSKRTAERGISGWIPPKPVQIKVHARDGFGGEIMCGRQSQSFVWLLYGAINDHLTDVTCPRCRALEEKRRNDKPDED